MKRVVFSLVPALFLLLTIEISLRGVEHFKPLLHSPPLTGEVAGIMRPDPDLFWSLVPGVQVPYAGANVTINRLGLRSSEVGEKQPGEFRILSLGESTTFGEGVEDDQTYSALLESHLTRANPGRKISVINAGVSCYSSVQSLEYLQSRGLALKPDLVLFYHEFNDLLPTCHRSSDNNVIDMSQTDRERLASARNKWHGWLLSHCATYRLLADFSARRAIRKVQNEPTVASMIKLSPDYQRKAFHGTVLELEHPTESLALKQRVPPADRLWVFGQLVELCRQHRVALVMIHPSYEHSVAHVCELTRFCDSEGVAVFDAQESLHPHGVPTKSLFKDYIHPNAAGHARLADALFEYLREQRLAPTAE